MMETVLDQLPNILYPEAIASFLDKEGKSKIEYSLNMPLIILSSQCYGSQRKSWGGK